MEKPHKWHVDESKPLSMETVARLENPQRKISLPPGKWLPLLGSLEGKVIADVACGTGFFITDILGAAGMGGRVFAIDIDSRMVEMVRNKFASERRVVGIKSEIAKIPLGNQSVDIAAMISTFHDLDGDATLLEVHRILRDGGIFLAVDWKKEKTPHGPPLEIRIGAEDAKLALEKVGFSCVIFDVSNEAYGIKCEKQKLKK